MPRKNRAARATGMTWKMSRRRDASLPLYRQVESLIHAGVADGRLQPGERIPSVSDLGRLLGVNKVTVVRAFQELERAGILSSHVGRGTFVSASPGAIRAGGTGSSSGADGSGGGAGSAFGSVTGSTASTGARSEVQRAVRRLRESYAGGLRELLALPRPPGTINLGGGVPAPETVTDETLARLTHEALASDPKRLFAYGGATGLPEFREQIAAWLRKRGTDVTPEQVIVTNGSQQAVMLLACWALDQGRNILCETPTFTGIPGAFSLVGHAVESVPWSGAAFDLAALESSPTARRGLFYVCPDFHNPTGQTLDLGARKAVAEWAARADRIVVSDEIFRDLRFAGDEPPSLFSLLPPGRRVLVGSLSKNFMTGLRAGFLVADQPLIRELAPFKRYMDLGSPALTQAVAARWLAVGHEAHLERVRTLYRERAYAAFEALDRHMPDGVRSTRPEGGFQLWVELPPGLSSVDLYLKALERGVAISPGPVHDVDGRYQNCFRLGYGHAGPRDLDRAIATLAGAFEALRAREPNPSATGLGLLV